MSHPYLSLGIAEYLIGWHVWELLSRPYVGLEAGVPVSVISDHTFESTEPHVA
jgi:hypothetical protein